jgi:methylated-DNA-protein-cysteine methyltransferase-like protein
VKITPQLDRIYATVMAIPAGRVATYGQVADAAGLPGRARLVGRALRELPDDSAVPWHRVVGAGGRLSPRGDGESVREQRLLLADEGVTFGPGGRIPLGDFAWEG